jgi:hypothetical protein
MYDLTWSQPVCWSFWDVVIICSFFHCPVHVGSFPVQCVFSNWISCTVFSRYSATVDCSGWPWHGCLMCSWHLISTVLDVWPTYTLSHSHGMQYTPDVFRPRSSLIVLKVLTVFFIGIWIFFMLCLANSLLSLLHVKCWYRSKATLTGHSVAVQTCCWCIGCVRCPNC